MSGVASARSTVTVPVDPATAFTVFTDEIELWYRRGLATWPADGRSGAPGHGLRFEPGGVGGRLVEVDAAGAAGRERARVTVWEPGERLVFVDGRDTEVEVTFTPTSTGTRVVLEHRGLDRLPPAVAARLAQYGWRRLAEWFERHLEETQ